MYVQYVDFGHDKEMHWKHKKDQNPAIIIIIIIIIITIIISSCHHSQWRSCRKGQSLDRSLPTGQTAREQGLPAIIYTKGEEL